MSTEEMKGMRKRAIKMLKVEKRIKSKDNGNSRIVLSVMREQLKELKKNILLNEDAYEFFGKCVKVFSGIDYEVDKEAYSAPAAYGASMDQRAGYGRFS